MVRLSRMTLPHAVRCFRTKEGGKYVEVGYETKG